MIPEKKGNKVLLIWPETDPGYYNMNPLGQIFGQKGVLIPLPLLYVASALGDDWDYTIADENISDISEKQLKESEYYLISANYMQWNSVQRLIKKLEPFQKPIIIGGPVFFIIPPAFDNSNVTAVIGEIESPEESSTDSRKTVAEVLSADMKAGKIKSQYKSAGHPDLKTIKRPRYDLLNPDKYFHFSLQTSRGCHNRCDFCQEVVLYGNHQRKNISQIIEELNQLVSLGHQKTVFIVDDNFIGNLRDSSTKSDLTELLHAIEAWQIKHNYPFDFISQCSLDIAEHDDIISLMAKIGLNIIFVGIETVNKDALSAVHKNQNVRIDIVAAIKKIQNHGIGIHAGLILGFDEDSEQSILDMSEFMKLTSIPYAGISLLSAFPGTKVFERFLKLGRISKDQNALAKSFRTNVITKMHPILLYKNFLKITRLLYSPDAYFSRAIAWTENWNDSYVIPGIKGSISTNFSSNRIIRSIIFQGLFSSYFLLYWQYLLYTLLKFRKSPNKRALSLFLIYFYNMIHKNNIQIDRFVKHIPAEIITEWENHYSKH